MMITEADEMSKAPYLTRQGRVKASSRVNYVDHSHVR